MRDLDWTVAADEARWVAVQLAPVIDETEARLTAGAVSAHDARCRIVTEAIALGYMARCVAELASYVVG